VQRHILTALRLLVPYNICWCFFFFALSNFLSMVSANPPAGPYLAELNFAVEESAPGAFEFPFVFRHPSGKPLYLAPHTVPIHDLRQQIRPPSLDREGFTWLSLPYDDLEGPDGWEDRYAKATCAWLMKHLGAKACKPINHQLRYAALYFCPCLRKNFIHSSLRRRTPEGKPSANYTQPDRTQGGQPVPAVHVDINRERASARVLTPFEGSEFSAETNRLAILYVCPVPFHWPALSLTWSFPATYGGPSKAPS